MSERFWWLNSVIGASEQWNAWGWMGVCLRLTPSLPSSALLRCSLNHPSWKDRPLKGTTMPSSLLARCHRSARAHLSGQRWARGVKWRCCSLLIFFFTRCHPYFLINSHAHFKLVLPQVTRFVKKPAFIKANFTLVVVWTHNSEGELCPHELHSERT